MEESFYVGTDNFKDFFFRIINFLIFLIEKLNIIPEFLFIATFIH